jgi:heterodisulfide reductase subunit B
MTESGYENYIPSCITSFGLYTEIMDTWHHFPEIEQKVRENLKKATGREFNVPKNLAHASDVIYKFRKEIAAKAIVGGMPMTASFHPMTSPVPIRNIMIGK